MRHQKKHGMKLGTSPAHTKAMKRSLVCALLENERIKTTLPRAKAIRTDADRVITWAKKGDLHSRRLAIALTNDKELVRETFEKAAQGMWQDRDGGYTRVIKLGPRKGDNAEMAIIELVTEPCTPKAKKEAAAPIKVEKPEPVVPEKVDESSESHEDVVPMDEQDEAEEIAESVEDAE